MRAFSVRPASVALVLVASALTACRLDKLVSPPNGPPSGGNGPVHLVFTAEPGTATAGSALSPAVQVTAEDQAGNVVVLSATVTVALGANPGGGTLSGTRSVALNQGVATFSNLAIDRAASGYTLAATASGASSAASSSFAVQPGPATALAFNVQPSSTGVGSDISPAVQVTANDAWGNRVTSFSGVISVALGHDGSLLGGSQLSGNTSAAATSGIATFSNLSINQAGTGFTLTTAFGSGSRKAESAAFSVTLLSPPGPGPASRLSFTTQPSASSAGAPLNPAVAVTALDTAGRTATSFAGVVTMTLASNPGGGSLTGTLTATASQGVATFSNLKLNRAASGYALKAASGSLATPSSSTFSVAPGPASVLAFLTQPSTTHEDSVIKPAVTVGVQDSFDNVITGFGGAVTLALGHDGSGGGTHLGGTVSAAAPGGVATFANLTLSQAGTGFTLTAAMGGGAPLATSAPFDVLATPPSGPGPPVRLAFSVQPTSTAAGAPITPAVVVTALDSAGSVAASFTGAVTLSLSANAAGATLSGTRTVSASGGVATFSTLSLDRSGSGYTLAAAASGLSGTTSESFTIAPGAPAALAFLTQPASADADSLIRPAVRVGAVDGKGNAVPTFAAAVTLSVAHDGSGGGARLGGATTQTASGGAATFADLTLDRAGNGYTLSATSGSLTAATSSAFDINASASGPPPPVRLRFVTQPSNAATGATITPPVQVAAVDSLGNTTTSFTGTVTVALASNPGGAQLSGGRSVSAVNGVATSSDLSLDQPGSGYTLSATSGSLTAATSATFDISAPSPPPAVSLSFVTQPSTTTAGSPIAPAVQVAAVDDQGNRTTSFTGTVTVALASNPGGAQLSGTRSVAAVNGIATFSDLSLDQTGSGYSLAASTAGLADATSSAFSVTGGSPSRLVFTVQPHNATILFAISPPVQVTAYDASGNRASGFTGPIHLAIGRDASLLGNASLSGATTVNAVGGVATFSDLSINQAGLGFTLIATFGAGDGRVESSSFDVAALGL